MGLAGLMQRLFGGRKGPSKEALFRAVPCRNDAVKEEVQEDGTIRLTAPLAGPNKGLYLMLAKAAKLPPAKSFELEEVGAFVWDLCDGKNTVAGIAGKLRERFRMNRLEAETALIAFLQTLGKRGLIRLEAGKKK